MKKPSPPRLYCEIVFLAGILCCVALRAAGQFSVGWVARDPLTFGMLTVGVLLGEMLPIKIARRGGEEELTFSASFALALLLTGGFGPALLAQGVASLLQDAAAKKPFWRLRFNLGQYTLAMAATAIVVHSLSTVERFTLGHPLGIGELPAMVLGVATFFVVNAIVVGIAVALYARVPIVRYFRSDLGFTIITGGVLVLVSPIVLATTAYAVWLVPLCMTPILAVYNSVSRGNRSDHAARHDALTGLPNRSGFHDAVRHAIGDGSSSTQACVLLIDLDRFKEINDTLGHQAGDSLLVGVAARFQEVIGRDGVIARLGGDEFAVVSHGRDQAESEELAQRLADALEAPFDVDGFVLDVQASVGIALFPEHGSSIDSLLQKADVAMYRAKQTRVDWSYYEEQYDHHSRARLSLAAELRAAVHNHDEIVPFYQPEIDLATGEVVAVEALARWEHPTLGELAPGEFIELAEETNLIKPLTQQLITTSLAQLGLWRRDGLELTVAVNVSARVLTNRGFAQDVKAALQRAGVPPTLLKLEVTESALMAKPIVARAVLGELTAHGVEISIDDFGTGYSSLSYLADLPVSEVKIDRSFVAAMDEGTGKRIIVSSTVDLAHNLGLRAVAEGVSDLAMLPALKALGCDAVQGFAIAEPMPARMVTDWIVEFDRDGIVSGRGAEVDMTTHAVADMTTHAVADMTTHAVADMTTRAVPT